MVADMSKRPKVITIQLTADELHTVIVALKWAEYQEADDPEVDAISRNAEPLRLKLLKVRP